MVRRKIAIGTTIGLTVGAVAGVLLAPKTGKVTRGELMKNIKELPDKAKELSEKTQEVMGELKEKITEETHKIMSGVGVKESTFDMDDEIHDNTYFQKPTEITEEQVDAFKKKLKQ